MLSFWGGVFTILYENFTKRTHVPRYWKQYTWHISILFPTSQWSRNVCWGNTYGELQKIAIWFRANKMVVNSSKTKFIVFRTRGKAANPNDCALLFNNNEPGQPIDPALSLRLKLLSVLLIFFASL
jgi:hypothetical protein